MTIPVEIKTALILLTGSAASAAVLPRLAKIALKMGLVDLPGRRKMHRTAKPLVGGLGMVMALAFTCLLWVPFTTLRGFFSGIVIMVTVGFLDDYRELGPKAKFLAQILAIGVMMFLSRIFLVTFGDLASLGPIDLGSIWLSVPLTVFCAMGVINAINMIDGLDGLAGGVSLVAFAAFAALAWLENYQELFFLNVALVGVLIGFLRYNWPPARLFMGDAGSLSLGFALAFMAIALTQDNNSVVRPAAALLVLTVPIVDTLIIMSKRLLHGNSPFLADRYHLHHILTRFGLSKKESVGVILVLSMLFSGLAIAGTMNRVPDHYLFASFMLYFVGMVILSFKIKYLMQIWLRRRLHGGGQAGGRG